MIQRKDLLQHAAQPGYNRERSSSSYIRCGSALFLGKFYRQIDPSKCEPQKFHMHFVDVPPFLKVLTCHENNAIQYRECLY